MGALDCRERIHLEWMFENQPGLVRELSRSNKLWQHLDKVNQSALRLVEKLRREDGLSEEEAFDVAMQAILAPADGPAMSDDPPDPVPWTEQDEIYRNLEAKKPPKRSQNPRRPTSTKFCHRMPAGFRP